MFVDKKTTSSKIKYSLNANARLLDAGVDVFGKHGFDAATTRMIAKKADVNIAAIPYYFNGKEGLYHAVVSHITGKLESQVKSTLHEIEERADEENLDRQEALALLDYPPELFHVNQCYGLERLGFVVIEYPDPG